MHGRILFERKRERKRGGSDDDDDDKCMYISDLSLSRLNHNYINSMMNAVFFCLVRSTSAMMMCYLQFGNLIHTHKDSIQHLERARALLH